MRQIAAAVLYEGYLLWPYRRSALKNTRRWTFGGVYPREHSERHPDDPWTLRTECLVESGPEGRVDVELRFLHVVQRQVARRRAGRLEPADELTVDGTRYLSWQEATERELALTNVPIGTRGQVRRRLPIAIAEQRDVEELSGAERDRATSQGVVSASGAPDAVAGAIVRTSRALRGAIEVSAQRLGPGLARVGVEVANTTPFAAGTREQALERTLCSTHAVLRAHCARFVSLTDPPPRLRKQAAACRNEGAWPVLVGEPGERRTLLAAPIILEDYPRVAPESPGDLFDGGEIDQLLTLNILSLTDAEKAEMRDSDPRARAILERTEALSEDELMALHGAIRDLRQAR